MSGGKGAQIAQALFLGRLMSLVGSKKMTAVSAKMNNIDLTLIAELISERKVVPLIEIEYPLDQAPIAIGHLGRGHAKGKVVISVGKTESR